MIRTCDPTAHAESQYQSSCIGASLLYFYVPARIVVSCDRKYVVFVGILATTLKTIWDILSTWFFMFCAGWPLPLLSSFSLQILEHRRLEPVERSPESWGLFNSISASQGADLAICAGFLCASMGDVRLLVRPAIPERDRDFHYSGKPARAWSCFLAHVGGFIAGIVLIKIFPERPQRRRYGTW